jgi:outer membrane protein assembly factor BamD
MQFTRLLLVLPVLAALLAGCASRGPAWDRMDAETLFTFGVEQLEARRWSDAEDAFRQLIARYPTHARVQEARFRLGQTYQGRREWITAATEFNRVASDYPGGPWADNARYEVCASYSRLAPRPQLDQEYTEVALEHCRSLLLYYPDSEFVPQAQELMVELENRLAEKEFRTADLYFGRRAYDSAIIYYQLVTDEYGTTVWAPRALLGLYRSYERLGYEEEARAARERLLREYPASPEARQIGGAGGAVS